MTNDTSTLNGSLQEVIDTLESNLQEMGVNAEFNSTTGIIGLADEILNISQGIELAPTITLTTTSSSEIYSGDNVIVSCLVECNIDDTSATNTDLLGVLKNATISFKDGNTTLGSASTDVNGVATYTLNNVTVGTHTISAIFNGTDYFSNCTETLNVTVTSPYTLTFNSNNYQTEDGDVTVSVTLLNRGVAMNGATVTITDGTNSYNCITDANGVGSCNVSCQSNTTLTATYSDATTTCTVTIIPILELNLLETDTFTQRASNPFTYTGVLEIDWGDGMIESYNGTNALSHTYSSSGNHTIRIKGNITSLNNNCFSTCSGLGTVTIPSSVTSIGKSCFYMCQGLFTVTIPSSVTSIGTACFRYSTVVDYQLYWDNPPINWSATLMPNNSSTYFTIPYGSTSNYVAKNFPSNKLIERNE